MTLNLSFKSYFILLNFFIFIFFFDLKYIFELKFDFRYFVFTLSFYLFKDIFHDLKKKNFSFLYIIAVFLVLTISYELYLGNLFNFYFYLSIVYLTFIFLVCYYYAEIFLNHKFFIFKIFVIIFLFSKIAVLIFQLNGPSPEPFSCGSVKNFFQADEEFLKNNFLIKQIHLISSFDFFFQENSHYAMVTVPYIFLILYYLTEKKGKIFFSKIDFFLIFLFIFFSYFKISATLIAGTILSILGFLIFQFYSFNKKFIIYSTVTSIILLLLFFSDNTCKSKLIPEYHNVNLTLLNKKEFASSSSSSSNKLLEKNITNNKLLEKNITNKNYIIKTDDIKKIKDFIDIPSGSLSSAVFYRALNITIVAFLEKPFGWGFQNYEKAFIFYTKNYVTELSFLERYHLKDGTNNFFKLITEFGIFGFFLYILLFVALFKKKISIENKLFLFSFVITQSIRGAGYFNGGFVLFVFIILILSYLNINKSTHINLK